ncbi:MAG: hypothetical protein KDB18_05820 [Salinibacterium sp.]|nr:hypothetical protein [Salinibacterium sp.]
MMRCSSYGLPFAFFALVAIAGCSKKAEESKAMPAPVASENPAPSASTPPEKLVGRFDKSVRAHPCELMTAAMVSRVAGVEASTLKQTTPATWCRYRGTDVTATIMFLRVSNDDERAAARFDHAYSNKSRADVKKVVGGSARVDASTKEPEVPAGHYETVVGPWDKAVVDVSERSIMLGNKEIKSYANTIHVRVANLSLSIEYKTAKPSLHKKELVALATAVTEGLPR